MPINTKDFSEEEKSMVNFAKECAMYYNLEMTYFPPRYDHLVEKFKGAYENHIKDFLNFKDGMILVYNYLQCQQKWFFGFTDNRNEERDRKGLLKWDIIPPSLYV